MCIYESSPRQRGASPSRIGAISIDNAETLMVVCHSLDGKVLGIVSSSGIHLYEAQTLTPRYFIETDCRISSLAISPDGKTLAAGSFSDKIELWRISDGVRLHTLEGHRGWVFQVVFSRDGKTLFSSSTDGTVRLWSILEDAHALGSGQLLHVLQAGTSWLLGLCASDSILVAGSFQQMRRWHLSDFGSKPQQLHTLKPHQDWITSLAITPDGKRLASASYDKIRLWELFANGKDIRPLQLLHETRPTILSLAMSPDGKILASGATDVVRLWRMSDGKLLHSLDQHTSPVSSLSFSPDGKILASTTTDMVQLWQIRED